MIPLSNITVDIYRPVTPVTPDEPFDPYDGAPGDGFDPDVPLTVMATGVRAVMVAPSGVPNLVEQDAPKYTGPLTTDPCDIQAGDKVIDNFGQPWRVIWANFTGGLGLDHVDCQVRYWGGLPQ